MYSTDYKKILINILENEDADKSLMDLSYHEKIEIVWETAKLVKDGDILLGLRIANLYKDVTDEFDNQYHEMIVKGEEPRIITTVRGAICWLLKDIIANFDTSIYDEVFNLIEYFSRSENLYIRQQAAVPLGMFSGNLRAVKTEGSNDYIIDEELKVKVRSLVFRMLIENCNYPRVLQFVIHDFDRMRDLNEKEALLLLNTVFYTSDELELQPEYLTKGAAPFALYYAEFRKDHYTPFAPEKFIDFIYELIKNSSNHEYLLATLIWNIWRTIKEEKTTFPRLIKYINKFFDYQMDNDAISQMLFLIENSIDEYPAESIDLFVKLTEKILEGSARRKDNNQLILFSVGKLLNKINLTRPELILDLAKNLIQIKRKGAYIDGISILREIYKKLPLEQQPFYDSIITELIDDEGLANG
jgi:hypothetical protein